MKTLGRNGTNNGSLNSIRWSPVLGKEILISQLVVEVTGQNFPW
jgi:hypothetical protein